MPRIMYTTHRPRGDLRHYLDAQVIEVILSRLPAELWERLKGVHFRDGRRRGSAGYVSRRGRREIVLCALPPRLSMSDYLRRAARLLGVCSISPSRYGAVSGCQWPPLAIRRYQAYHTFLHEIGHLQVINSKNADPRRRFAMEPRAEEFVWHWQERLWSTPFEHPDPVHNPPSPEELDAVTRGWKRSNEAYRRGLSCEWRGAKKRDEAALHYTRAVELFEGHSYAAEALGIYTYSVLRDPVRASGLLRKAVVFDPGLHDANLFLGLSLAETGALEDARRHFERAVELSWHDDGTLAVYARVLGEHGLFDEAQGLFRRAVTRSWKDPFVAHNYMMFTRLEGNPYRACSPEELQALKRVSEPPIAEDRLSISSRGLEVWFEPRHR